jgi:ABC-type antimicrobial peptide transport system permease subunit
LNTDSALGRRLKIGRADSTNPWLTVIGVVADVRQGGLTDSLPPDIYRCLAQSPPRTPPILNLLVRPKGLAAAALTVPLEQAARSVTSTLPLYDIATLEQRLDVQAARGRFLALLMTLFSGLALVLAVIGIYGVISYSVGQRRREIGIRLALGADRSSILRLVVAGSAAMALVGIGLGLLLALGLGPVVTGKLTDTFHSIEPVSPLIFAGAALLFLTVAIAASLVPARRATSFEAAITLREE